MRTALDPFLFLVTCIAEWMNQHQHDIIELLNEAPSDEVERPGSGFGLYDALGLFNDYRVRPRSKAVPVR